MMSRRQKTPHLPQGSFKSFRKSISPPGGFRGKMEKEDFLNCLIDHLNILESAEKCQLFCDITITCLAVQSG